MKRSKPKNSFSDDTRSLFFFQHSCWDCGINRSLELDHCLGRSVEHADSPLNAYLNCRTCHKNKTHADDSKRLQKTLTYLLSQDYKLTDKDAQFYEKNKRLYINQA